jgi:hypothetical protein
MNLDNNINYRYIGSFNTDSFLNKIIDNNLSWDDYEFRQIRYKDHSETRTIPIIFSERFLDKDMIWERNSYIFREEIESIEKYLRKNLSESGKIMSLILIKLPAGKSIGRHRDANPIGDRFNRCHRIHIPIKTNDKCFFEIDGEIKNMKKDEVWEISNLKKLHSVSNKGDTDRIHILIDWDPI